MCKLLIMTGITEPITTKLFMDYMAIPMSERNNHGIGYAAVDGEGNLFSERWFHNYSYMSYDTIMVPEIAKKLMKYQARLPYGALETNYSRHGTVNFNDARSIILHTRFATSDKIFPNTHPFIYEDTALIHNGSIRNADTLKVNKISTCDSEAALQTYLQEGVGSDTSKAKGWLNILSGSYAFGILGRDSTGGRILDVVRGTSFLYYMEIEGVGKVYTTDKDDAIKVVKHMGLSFIKEPFLVGWDEMYRYNAITGEIIEEVKVKNPVVQTNYSDYYWNRGSSSTNHSGGNGSSSSEAKNKNLPKNIGKTKNSSPTIDDVNLYRHDGFIDGKGNWDFHAIAKFNKDSNEPIEDRLYLFDRVYSTNYLNAYETVLSKKDKDMIEQTDLLFGFREARKEIEKTANKIRAAANH